MEERNFVAMPLPENENNCCSASNVLKSIGPLVLSAHFPLSACRLIVLKGRFASRSLRSQCAFAYIKVNFQRGESRVRAKLRNTKPGGSGSGSLCFQSAKVIIALEVGIFPAPPQFPPGGFGLSPSHSPSACHVRIALYSLSLSGHISHCIFRVLEIECFV
jgi:hypothetical protein